MLNDSWAGRNPTRVVVPIEEEEMVIQGKRNDLVNIILILIVFLIDKFVTQKWQICYNLQ
jgi:hypothetical protein